MEKSTETAGKKMIGIKHYAGIVLGVIFFFLTYWGTQQLFFKPPSIDQQLMQFANEINKNCPVMLNETTRLDNTIALPDKVFQYNYTLLNVTKNEMDPEAIKKQVLPEMINDIRTIPEMKYLREYEVTFVYYYKDKNGEFVYKIPITPDMYSGK